ncbi:hypothetical protein LIER_15261 [Lithospermum erythrorhizon]|uniref:Reverse transcriptase n=1 Tax=Lithospermum erythrorhizon TaxID=34254 RepID=A0AAV3Q260_LITER
MRMHQGQNRITTMKNDEGLLVEEYDKVNDIIVEFYKNLFSPPEDSPHIEAEIEKLNVKRIYEADALIINNSVTVKEIENTMMSMKRGKAPGPDGFTTEIYKDSWQITKDTVVEAVQTFFATCQMPRHMNNTIIFLIPKVPNPQNMKEYRPISCYNTVYKCITTILANRLKHTLHNVIALQQTADVSGEVSMMVYY